MEAKDAVTKVQAMLASAQEVVDEIVATFSEGDVPKLSVAIARVLTLTEILEEVFGVENDELSS